MNDWILERVIWVEYKQEESPIESEVNEGLSEIIRDKWTILDINTNVFKNSNAPVAILVVPSVSIVCKRGLFEIVNEFTFINDFFFTTILCKQGLYDILISLVISLQYPSFTVIEVHPFWLIL